MPFSQAEIQELPFVISAARFATYLQAMGNDHERALALYEWNLDVSSAMIVPLQVCEVAIRNGVAEAIERVHGANWPWNNGFIRSLPRPKGQFRYNAARDLQACATALPTTGKIIAELKFAFWEHIFTAGQDGRIWNPHFHACFPGAPHGQIAQCRATAYADLRAIRHLRNRIAHHEPIFTRNLADDYQRIHDMIAWRSQVAAAWMDGKQTVLTLLAAKP
ncbi:hypothetical protein EWE75_24010 [Sphingomonas populi]|uniref:Abi family protein n=1 Tax=Sphingomonas populi TaxID=2484750 RepID=A0A4V2DBS8_9SPHN|nr:hypothetical protein [Sphingomonas populi]RZF59038.1 hypothetical protein EWE75_24010 [Sphingomonas populi]